METPGQLALRVMTALPVQLEPPVLMVLTEILGQLGLLVLMEQTVLMETPGQQDLQVMTALPV
jgi:hypothetical protein